MAIKASTSKILWARSGNRCAICDARLTADGANGDAMALGMEAHIVARSEGGPRGDADFEQDRDGVDNLILLCASDHMIVDKDPVKYTVEELRRIKREHEERIERLVARTEQLPQIKIIGSMSGVGELVTSATQLWAMVSGAEAGQFNSPDPETDEEVALLSNVLGYWEDVWGISSEFGQSEIINIKREMGRQLDELREAGFIVFATVLEGRLTGGVLPDMPWRTVSIKVVRADIGRAAQPVDPNELSDVERAVFAIMLEPFIEKGTWLTLPVLSKRVHKFLGVNVVKVLDNIPRGLTSDETSGKIFDGQRGRFGLTIAGIALTAGSERLTELFVDALQRLVQIEFEFEPDEDVDEPPDQVISISELAEVYGSDVERRQVAHMLPHAELLVWNAGGEHDEAWQFRPNRHLRDFDGIDTIEAYLLKRRETLFGIALAPSPDVI